MDPELLYITLAGLGSAIIITKIIIGRGGPKKAAKKMNSENDRAVMDHYKTLLEINEDQKVTIKSLRGKVQRALQLDEESISQSTDPQEMIKSAMPLIQQVAKGMGIPPDKLQGLLSAPEVQEWISNPKNLKKLTEYAPLIQTFLTKNKQGAEPESTVYEGTA